MAQAADTLTPRDQVALRSAAPRRPSRYGRAACLAWITAAAASIGLGDIHRDHTSDSILPALQSLYRWQPYYWEQNRYGMPVALLASPVRNPFHNLLFQNALTIWLGLAAFPLAVRYFRGATCRPGSPEIDRSLRDGLLAAGAFALFAPLHFQFVYLTTDNVFGTSLALGLAALILLEKPGRARLAGAILLMLPATWCNTAIGALLLFLVVGLTPIQNLRRRGLVASDPSSADPSSADPVAAAPPAGDRRPDLRRRVSLQVGLSMAAVAVGLEVLGRIPPPEYRNTFLVLPSFDQWPALVAKQFRDLCAANDPLEYWAALVAACAVVVAVAARRRVAGAARAAAMLSLTTLAMGAFALAMGILVDGRWRYGIPAMVLLHAAAVAAATLPLPAAPLLLAAPAQAALPPRAAWLPRAAAVLPWVLLAILPWQHGLPSYARVRSELFARFDVGRHIVDARCTHVAGDYWRVWPAVFAANCRLYEEGADRTVWGLAHRSMPTEPSWRSIPAAEIRAATFLGDPEAERYLRLLAPNWSEAERRAPLAISVIGD